MPTIVPAHKSAGHTRFIEGESVVQTRIDSSQNDFRGHVSASLGGFMRRARARAQPRESVPRWGGIATGLTIPKE